MRQGQKTKQGFFQNKGRPSTTTDYAAASKGGNLTYNAIAQDRDIFEDDDDNDAPGPGSYYNPQNQTCFKASKIPERL